MDLIYKLVELVVLYIVLLILRIKCLDKSPRYRKREEKHVNVEVDITLVSISSINLGKGSFNTSLIAGLLFYNQS